MVVPTNPLYTPPELEHQLNDAGVTVIVMLDQFYPALASVRERTPLKHVILTNVSDYFPTPLALAYKASEFLKQRGRKPVDMKALLAQPGNHTFKELLGPAHGRQGFEVFALPEPAAPDDLALLQYTGGTTGVAKGAMLTHRNLLANALQCWAWNELAARFASYLTLCRAVLPRLRADGRHEPQHLWRRDDGASAALHGERHAEGHQEVSPDLFPGVPTMYLALAREVERTKQDLSSIKVCISGSAPLPLEVQTRFEAVSGARVVEGYGLTEASPVTHCNPVFGERRIGTIGLPLPETPTARSSMPTRVSS